MRTTIGVTGHRPPKIGFEWNGEGPYSSFIKERLSEIFLKNFEEPRIITGMALGVDQLAAEVAMNFGWPFTAAIPCLNQEGTWPEDSKQRYRAILAHPLCTRVLVSNHPYFDGCMQIRNRWIVDNSQALVAVWNGSPGGTANCVRYANSVGIRVLTINPEGWKK